MRGSSALESSVLEPSALDGHLVASFRTAFGPGRSFLERARSLIARMTPLGGVHVGLDAMKVTFAFDASKFVVLLEAVIASGAETEGDEPPWAVGIAHGDLRRVNEEGSPLTESGLLWWGPPLVAASALAALARPGEILCAQTVPALRAGELVTSGLRIARDGTLRVRGARIDRRQPWRTIAAANLARMTEPRLFQGHLPSVAVEPGALVVVRADPGAGGTRVLQELASRATRALFISSVGSGFEPLGALRRALERSVGGELHPMLLELAVPLEALLAGKGVSLDAAAQLISAFLWPKQTGANTALIVDDAKSVDPATLEACVRAVRQTPSIGMVARLDATSGIPSVLAALPKAAEHELPTLSREGSEDIAAGSTGGALDSTARTRWARLGGENPLAIVEAVAFGIATGDITWSGDVATPRSRAAGRGEVRPAAKWIQHRANGESTPVRALLSLLAAVGGDAKVGFLSRVLEAAGLRMDLLGTIAQLERSGWLAPPNPSAGGERSIALRSRTHQKALFGTFEDNARRKLHLAIAQVIEQEEGVFGRVEGAWHAAQAGEGARAAALFLAGARGTADARLEASTTQLIAFARRVDPSCEEVALELLANALARASSHAPPPVSRPPSVSPSAASSSTEHASIPAPRATMPPPTSPAIPPPVLDVHAADSGPPTLTDPRDITTEAVVSLGQDSGPRWSGSVAPADVALTSPPPPVSEQGSEIAARLGELAKEALLASDNAALERWVDGLRAAGESPAFTERMRAMARLGRGDIGDALSVLRRTRAQLDPNDHRRRCQTSLALGVALSVAGRPQEALLEGLDALARARETNDEQGAKACLAFLAKLYTAVSREEEATRLRAKSA